MDDAEINAHVTSVAMALGAGVTAEELFQKMHEGITHLRAHRQSIHNTLEQARLNLIPDENSQRQEIVTPKHKRPQTQGILRRVLSAITTPKRFFSAPTFINKITILKISCFFALKTGNLHDRKWVK